MNDLILCYVVDVRVLIYSTVYVAGDLLAYILIFQEKKVPCLCICVACGP